jgi:hypothetical protein
VLYRHQLWPLSRLVDRSTRKEGFVSTDLEARIVAEDEPHTGE